MNGESIKGISLWEPWASAVALGIKQWETRNRATNVRGPLAIHAAQRRTMEQKMDWIHMQVKSQAIHEAFREGGAGRFDAFPFGQIIAVVFLGASFPSDEITILSAEDRILGKWGSGRWGWQLNRAYKLKTPIPFKAHQGFFNVPIELFDAADRPELKARFGI